MPMIIGYESINRGSAHLDMQIAAIEKYAADKNNRLSLFSEKESGGKEDRMELKKALDQLQKGDTFVIYNTN